MIIKHCAGLKKKNKLGQVLVCSFNDLVADNLHDPLPSRKVRMKGYLPKGESTCPGQLDSTFFKP